MTLWALRESSGAPLVRDLCARLVVAPPQRTAEMLAALRGLVARTPELDRGTREHLLAVSIQLVTESDCPQVIARSQALVTELAARAPAAGGLVSR